MVTINIDGMEFIFLFMGYGLGLLEFGYKRGWLILGLMLILMIMQGLKTRDIIQTALNMDKLMNKAMNKAIANLKNSSKVNASSLSKDKDIIHA